jgi:tetratricopeptide (TPR) repeat protein
VANDLSGEVHGSVVQAHQIGQVVVQAAQERRSAGDQAPAPPHGFVNRTSVHEKVDKFVAEAREQGKPALICLYGPGGVGTTGAATVWAKAHRDEFQDGTVYLRLSDPERSERASLGETLGSALSAMGVPAGELRATAEDRAADLRALTADKKVLFLLDDLINPGQVQSFIPTGAGCAVLATSRWLPHQLAISGFRFAEVPPLAVEYTHLLLGNLLASHDIAISADDSEVVVRASGGFPLAIELMAAALFKATPRSRGRLVAAIAERGWNALGDDAKQLLVEHLDFAYERLQAPVAAVYKALAWHPGPVFDVQVAVRALDSSAEDVLDSLDALTTAGLLTLVEEDVRYRFHDLAHQHARTLSTEPDTEVIGRIADWYLQCAVTFDKVLSGRPRSGPLYGLVPDVDVDGRRSVALRWLEAERTNLTAMVELAEGAGHDELAWQLCEALWGIYHLHGHYDDWIATHRIGLAAAKRCGRDEPVMRISSQLGAAHLGVGELDDAQRCFDDSYAAAVRIGHRQGQQSALEWSGKTSLQGGAAHDALAWFAKSWRVAADEREFAILRLQQGRARLRLAEVAAEHGELETTSDEFEAARGEFESAVRFFRGTAESDNLAKCLSGLGQALGGLRETEAARAALTEAEQLFAADRSLRKQVEVLYALADLGDGEVYRVRAEEILGQLGSVQR